MLRSFILENREGIIARAGTNVAARLAPRAAVVEHAHGLPAFMDQVIEALAPPTGMQSASIAQSAGAHGAHLLRAGFTCSQVVHDYGSVCQAITALASETNAPICADEFRILNRCLDDAIAGAVTEYSRLREEAIDLVETEHIGVLARELRHPLAAALLTYKVLSTGTVGIGGTTGTALGRNLRRVSALIDRTMAQVRLDAGAQSRERVSVFAFIEELEVGAALEADARGLSLSVTPGEPGVDLDVDRQLLTAAVSNLVQNALQFTRPGGHVVLKGSCTDDRVRIEIEDECGGLAPGVEDALRGAFARPGAGGPPLGPGLAVVRESVEAIGAKLRVRDIPRTGCVFVLDLQRKRESDSNGTARVHGHANGALV